MVQHQHQHDAMIKKIFLILCLCLLSNIVWAGSNKPGLNPCGLNGMQRDGLTFYFHNRFSAEYKDLSKEDVVTFLNSIEKKDTKVTNIRIFKSPHKEGYAVILSYLFQNFLGGEVLVELNCIAKIYDSPVIYITEEGLQKFIGKSYEEIE